MEDHKEHPKEKNKKKRLEEQAIDEKATSGERINPQQKQKKEQHLPRDTA